MIYDRVDDADVKVTATGQIAAMYIRKQSIFTENNAEVEEYDSLVLQYYIYAKNLIESHI